MGTGIGFMIGLAMITGDWEPVRQHNRRLLVGVACMVAIIVIFTFVFPIHR